MKSSVRAKISTLVRRAELTYFASRAATTFRADAGEATDSIDAGRSTQTRLRRTFVHVDPAVGSGKSLGANASKPARTGFARSAIVARLPLALIEWIGGARLNYAFGTRFSCKKKKTLILIINTAGEERSSHTRPIRWAFARELPVAVLANSFVFARIRQTVVDICGSKFISFQKHCNFHPSQFNSLYSQYSPV